MDREIMKKRYESLQLKVLRDLAKQRGLEGISGLRKGDLVERMLVEDERDAAAAKSSAPEGTSEKPGRAAEQESSAKESAGKKSTAKKTASRTRKTAESRHTGRTSSGRTEGRTQSGRNEGRNASVRDSRGRKNVRDHAEERTAAGNTEYSGSGDAGNDENRLQPYDEDQGRYEEENRPEKKPYGLKPEIRDLDTGEKARGVLEIMQEGYGFLRSDNFLPGEDDVYVSPSQIRKFHLRTGDMVAGSIRENTGNEKYNALLYVSAVNDDDPEKAIYRPQFETLTPVFPDQRIRLERAGGSVAMRIVDLVSPIGKGQRGMIVSPPKAGKTTLLKDMAQSILVNNPEMRIIILLIDERPEEVTDIRETVTGDNVEVLYSTFDELPEHHKRVADMAIEHAKRMVEGGQDVIIFIDSITRLARANNQVVPPSGRTLSGGLDPAALHMPKKFFGAARNIRNGGSLTILATALVETGSKMDDVVYEEFKGTGNMELFLDRKLQERRVFPAIDLAKSGTRREDLLLTREERDAVNIMRRSLVGMKAEEAGENILNMFAHTKTNQELVQMIRRSRMI